MSRKLIAMTTTNWPEDSSYPSGARLYVTYDDGTFWSRELLPLGPWESMDAPPEKPKESDAEAKPAQDPVEAVTSRKIRRLERDLELFRGEVNEWIKWASNYAPMMLIEEARSEIARLVELGRECADTEAKLRVCSEQFDAAMSDWGKAAELLGRIVKCADEGEARIPDLTRLGRAVEEAREMLRPAVPVKEPEAGELEMMLTQLMGQSTDDSVEWSWTHSWLRGRDEGTAIVQMDKSRTKLARTPAEALAAINTRLAGLAPDGWKATVELLDDAWVVRCKNEPTTGKLSAYVDYVSPVNADLGARITEALEWIAEREKPKPETKPSELETMLAALMGGHCPHPQPWRWYKQQDNYYLYVPKHDGGLVCLGLQGRASRVKYGVREALQAINARLRRLAPEGWKLELSTPYRRVENGEPGGEPQGRWTLDWSPIGTPEGQWREVKGDLGVRIAEALEWIAEREKPKPKPKPEPAAGELEMMLTQLMGSANAEKARELCTWEWARSSCAFRLDGYDTYCESTAADVLQTINTRLAELAPAGWKLELMLDNDRWFVWAQPGEVAKNGIAFQVRGDLGARITEVLKWISAQEKPKPSDLERMLTALMGPAATGPWSWGSRWDEEKLSYFMRPDDGMLRAVFGPAEALAAINARLAELAPAGWAVYVRGAMLFAKCEFDRLQDYQWVTAGNLGARVTEALAWIAERDADPWNPKPAPDEPIKPPEGVTELSDEHCVKWESAEHEALVMRDLCEIQVGDAGIPDWLPRLYARARQVFGKEGAK